MTFFFNDPPRIASFEMISNMPCSDAHFEAANDFDYQRQALLEPESACLPSLFEFSIWMGQDQWVGLQDPKWSFISVHHLLGLICCKPSILKGEEQSPNHFYIIYIALNSVYFSSRMARTAQTTSHEMDRLLDRWKSLWNSISKKDQENSGPPPAFTMHAVEVWWVLKKVIEIVGSSGEDHKYVSGIAFKTAKELNDFIYKVNPTAG